MPAPMAQGSHPSACTESTERFHCREDMGGFYRKAINRLFWEKRRKHSTRDTHILPGCNLASLVFSSEMQNRRKK